MSLWRKTVSTTPRVTATVPDGTVAFLVGMRINHWWALHKILPVFLAMPKMIIEQVRQRELGMIGSPRTFVSGRLILVIEYWKSYEHLETYAKATDRSHLSAWGAFNRAARGNRAVGVFHETYVVKPGTVESIYSNVPNEILLGAAVGTEPIGRTADSSRQRLKNRKK